MWVLLVGVLWGAVMGGLATLGAVLAYAKRHPGVLIRAGFEYGLDRPDPPGGDSAAKP